MFIGSQGFGHFTNCEYDSKLGHYIIGQNNQDFGFDTSRMALVADGCSGAKISEVGTRLFTQIFLKKEGYDKPEKFESNVKEVFDDLIAMMRKHYASEEEYEQEYIMENLLFTIIACFETEEEYIVKLFGDGYVITQNHMDVVSYLKYSYGPFPPYYAYKYCKNDEKYGKYKNYEIKTIHFSKKNFKKVGVATDGIAPVVKDIIPNFDEYIVKENTIAMGVAMERSRQSFKDDVTICFIKGDDSI